MLTAVIAPPHNDIMPIMAGVEGTELSESQLVERFRQTGDSRHFETLYLRTRRSVYSRCLAILKDGESAEDQTHETFLRAYDQFSSLQGDNFSGWVYRWRSHGARPSRWFSPAGWWTESPTFSGPALRWRIGFG